MDRERRFGQRSSRMEYNDGSCVDRRACTEKQAQYVAKLCWELRKAGKAGLADHCIRLMARDRNGAMAAIKMAKEALEK